MSEASAGQLKMQNVKFKMSERRRRGRKVARRIGLSEQGALQKGIEEIPRVHGKWQQALREGGNSDNLQAMKATMPEPEIVTRKGKPVSVIMSAPSAFI